MEKSLIPVECFRGGDKYCLNLQEDEISRMEKDSTFFDEIIDKYAPVREETVTITHKVNDEDGENIWKENEVKFFISLYGEHLNDFKSAKRKKQMWNIIAEKMQCQGYNRNAEKCQRKWINMTRAYRSVKDNRGPKSSGRGKRIIKTLTLSMKYWVIVRQTQ
ncbi:hypothetical protein ABEB36_009625 [Hypothenemus hampei]|uniref:Myb-like domain-containing protein n=1 Tax=Hypothenemus hampei TaxID=57062 RepID=A0ABD1EH52_HYPHA